jgi:DNA-binding NarL/FixJ family response regulator
MIRVVIADDHPMMREGVKYILGRTEDLEIVGEASNGLEVIAAVRMLDIHVLVLDLNMPGRHGIELIAQIVSEAPKVSILVWSGLDERQYALRAMRAGARGYINKEREIGELLEAIRRVARGQRWINAEVAELMAEAWLSPSPDLPHNSLSPREYEVFWLLIQGHSVAEIARSQFLSHKTVSTYKAHILEKMNMHSVVELVHYAVAHGLLDC